MALGLVLCPTFTSHRSNISLVSQLPSGPASNRFYSILTPGRDLLGLGHTALELCPGINFIHGISADVPTFTPSENPAGSQKCSLF